MTEQAGDTKQGLLWKQEHLAPLPIPTGQPASDLMNIVWRKNQVFLDIGSFAMGGLYHAALRYVHICNDRCIRRLNRRLLGCSRVI